MEQYAMFQDRGVRGADPIYGKERYNRKLR